MSVPQIKNEQGEKVPKPIKLHVPQDPQDWRLDDIQLFEPEGFSVKAFKAFMAAYSNWTAAEVGQLTGREMADVVKQVGAELEAGAVPKASGAGS